MAHAARTSLELFVDCASLLEAASLDKLHTQGKGQQAPRCSVKQTVGTKEIQGTIRLGSSPTVGVGELVLFRPEAAVNISNGTTMPVLRPRTAAQAHAIIRAPRTLGSCADLVLDGRLSSGFGGREGKYAWSVRFPTNAVKTYTTPMVKISRTELNGDAEYAVNLSVTNFLGSTDNTSTSIKVTSGARPVVTIAGPPKITVPSSDELRHACTHTHMHTM